MKKSACFLSFLTILGLCSCTKKGASSSDMASSSSSLSPYGKVIEKEAFYGGMKEKLSPYSSFKEEGNITLEGIYKKENDSVSYALKDGISAFINYDASALKNVSEEDFSSLKDFLVSGKSLFSHDFTYGEENSLTDFEVYYKEKTAYVKSVKGEECSYYQGSLNGMISFIESASSSIMEKTGYHLTFTNDDFIHFMYYAEEEFFTYYQDESSYTVVLKINYTTLRRFLESSISYYVKVHDDIDIPLLNSQNGAVSAGYYIANMVTIRKARGTIVIPADGATMNADIDLDLSFDYDEKKENEDGTVTKITHSLSVKGNITSVINMTQGEEIVYPDDLSSWKQDEEAK